MVSIFMDLPNEMLFVQQSSIAGQSSLGEKAERKPHSRRLETSRGEIAGPLLNKALLYSVPQIKDDTPGNSGGCNQ